MADYDDDEEDVVLPEPDPFTGAMPPVVGYDGEDTDLGVFDFLVMSILLIGFVLIMLIERRCCKLRLWEVTEIVTLSLLGMACYFGPTLIFDLFVLGNSCDMVHMMLVQANGAALLGLAGCRIRSFCAGKTTKTGHSSLILARLIGGIALLITIMTDQQNYSLQDYKHKLSNLHLTFIIFGCTLWILGNGVILWNFPRFGHFCMNSRLSMNLVIDIIATSLIVFWWYGYPQYTLYNLVLPDFKPDGVHAHFLRTLACLVLINILHGVGSMRFHDNLDRQGYFFSNLVIYFLVVPLVVAQQSTLKLYTTSSFVQYIVLIAFMLVNCFIGYLNPGCPCACVSAIKDGSFDICDFDICNPELCRGKDVEPCKGGKSKSPEGDKVTVPAPCQGVEPRKTRSRDIYKTRGRGKREVRTKCANRD